MMRTVDKLAAALALSIVACAKDGSNHHSADSNARIAQCAAHQSLQVLLETRQAMQSREFDTMILRIAHLACRELIGTAHGHLEAEEVVWVVDDRQLRNCLAESGCAPVDFLGRDLLSGVTANSQSRGRDFDFGTEWAHSYRVVRSMGLDSTASLLLRAREDTSSTMFDDVLRDIAIALCSGAEPAVLDKLSAASISELFSLRNARDCVRFSCGTCQTMTGKEFLAPGFAARPEIVHAPPLPSSEMRIRD